MSGDHRKRKKTVSTKDNSNRLSEALLSALRAAGASGAPATEIGQDLAERGLRGHSVPDLRLELLALQRAGLAVEWARRWYLVDASEWRVGVVSGASDGTLLVRGRGRDGRVYRVQEQNARGARRNDRVLLKRVRKRSRAAEPEASVVRILDRRSPGLVGMVEEGERGRSRLIGFERFDHGEVELEGEVPAAGTWVLAELDEGRGSGRRRARVTKVFGPSSEPGVDLDVVLAHYGIPDEFPTEVTAAASRLPADPDPLDYSEREDLRQEVLVTIDGETARDFDDAISVKRKGSGFELGVHIADVAEYVKDGSAIDREALERGTSVYFTDRAVPMLPEDLSNGLCSLRPSVPRLALSAFLDIDTDGRITAVRFAETLIESRARLTYTQVNDWLAGDDGALVADDAVRAMLRDAASLYEVFAEDRQYRGTLDFDLPSGRIVLDDSGVPVDIEAQERGISHRMIEEFMIAANEAVATTLVSEKIPGLFRAHESPSALRITELLGVLRSLGLELPGGGQEEVAVTPLPLQELLSSVSGASEERLVSMLVLRTMDRARYDPENHGHYALALDAYSHFTSPIRRYPDLFVHRQLKAWLNRQPTDVSRMRLQHLAEVTSEKEQRAEQAERQLLQWKKVRVLEARIGEVMEGHITGVQPFGLFVQLDEWLADGLVPIATLRDDYYVFDSAGHLLTGERSGRCFRLADAVTVRLVGTSERHRGLDLEVEDMPREPTFRARSRKRGAGNDRGQRSKRLDRRGDSRAGENGAAAERIGCHTTKTPKL